MTKDAVTILFSVFLVLAAGGLIASHVLTWRRMIGRDPDDRERKFAWRQFRRRMQTSVMIALVAVALPIGVLVPMPKEVYLLYWLGVVLVVLWIVLLAGADALASHHHFGRIRDEQLYQGAKLRGELYRQRHKKNGRKSGNSKL